jgi:hypothetical protein
MQKMNKTLLILFTLGVFASMTLSCKTKQTCAAYHSHFLLFPEVQDKYFSLFEETDSAFKPKEGLATTDKLWSGISTGPNSKRTYKKRHYIIPMKDVYRPVEGQDSAGGTSFINIDSTKNNRKFSN